MLIVTLNKNKHLHQTCFKRAFTKKAPAFLQVPIFIVYFALNVSTNINALLFGILISLILSDI